jgi:hypothetical protein
MTETLRSICLQGNQLIRRKLRELTYSFLRNGSRTALTSRTSEGTESLLVCLTPSQHSGN